jgi:hypothetical protein
VPDRTSDNSKWVSRGHGALAMEILGILTMVSLATVTIAALCRSERRALKQAAVLLAGFCGN